MTNQEILDKAKDIVLRKAHIPYGHTFDEFLEDLPTLQVFAKALWGEEVQAGLSEANGHWYINISQFDERSYIEVLDLWQYHLQQMVIADDPIEYLGEHLPA